MSSPRPGRPVDGAKRALILQTASRHFLQDGFAATSIEQIAAEAGVSKVTIYNHFGDKEALFSESVATECERISGSFRIDAEPDLDLRQRLIAVGESLSAFLSRPEMVQFERRIAAETEREPAVGAAFLSAGPHRMKKALVALLVSMNEAGEVDIADPDLAAEQFAAMCKGMGDLERRFGLPRDEVRDGERIRGAVEVFCRAYASG